MKHSGLTPVIAAAGPELVIIIVLSGAGAGVAGLWHLWTADAVRLRSVGLSPMLRIVFTVLMLPVLGLIALVASLVYRARFGRRI